MIKQKKYAELVQLKKFLKRKNISYGQLASILGISIDAVNNKLNGYTDLTLSEMNSLIYKFDMSTSDVMKYFTDENEVV